LAVISRRRNKDWTLTTLLTADEAARKLRVSRATLYAYVSRGLVQAQPAEDPRQRRYSAEAVEKLAEDRKRGRKPKEIAKAALNFGVPVLESGLTAIAAGRLFYRGQDAVALARSATLEDVAALLWGAPPGAAFPARAPAFAQGFAPAPGAPVAERLLTLFAATTEDGPTAVWLPPEQVFSGCGALVRIMAALTAGAGAPEAQPIHRQLARAYGLDGEGTELLRAALVLSADTNSTRRASRRASSPRPARACAPRRSPASPRSAARATAA
jgi:citrate synthase